MLEAPTKPTHVVVIVGGAVAGSEAAALCASKGATAIVLDQNARPFGKIEDGLPRWHSALRRQEYSKIGENLRLPGVYFVPKTRVGRDVSFETLAREFRASAVLLANGAWRDRPLPIAGADRFVGHGLLYQNAFVYWYNHYLEKGYTGPRFDVPDGTMVVGGGLASVDVVKIINFELYGAALRARGVEVDAETLETKGIPAVFEAHGLKPEELGVRGCTLFYRRRKQDMPLASADDPTPEQMRKIEAARVKIMDKVLRKYLVAFRECAAPVGVLADGERLTGLTFRRTEIRDGKVIELPGTDFDVSAPLVVSSIGSVPEPMAGVPMSGELYKYQSWVTGELTGVAGVFGLGNVLTGKGNIKASRESARDVATRLMEGYLGVGAASEAKGITNAMHDAARSAIEPTVERAMQRAPLSPEQVRTLLGWVRERWSAVGYPGEYEPWIKAVTPADLA